MGANIDKIFERLNKITSFYTELNKNSRFHLLTLRPNTID